ncbi:MAG: hypothetical protein MJE63_30720 [Proteobacteria bacterium]|nr:hypothetical protein [Pseudomonadota bacterium]
MKSEALFNRRKRRVNRSHIPPAELIISSIIITGLILVIGWISLQRNEYNPEDRDLPDKYLDTGIITSEIYHPPLQRWSEGQGQGPTSAPNTGLLATDILNDSWQVNSSLKEFNADTLFEKINGEADKFLQQGFKNLQFIRIVDAERTNEIGIELYDQGDLKGSLGVFAEYVSPNATVKNHESVVYIVNRAGAVGRKGRFFARLIGNRESPVISTKAEEIMKLLVSLPQAESDIPFEYNILTEKLKINPAFISYQNKNVFQFDFARHFWFGTPDPGSSGRVFIHRLAEGGQEPGLLSRLVQEQQYDYKTIRSTPNFAVMQHLYLKTWFVIRQEGSVIYGVEKMKNVDVAQQYIQQTSAILANESGIEN